MTGMAEYIDKTIAVKGLRTAHDLDGADFVANIPAVDAVEVVRCRECAVPHNAATGCPLLLGIRVDPDFYCKFGYRETQKDGDGHGTS